MGFLEPLTREIERVVSSPYAVSLKRLHDILLECDASTVHTWANASICHVAPLASAVKEALELWPYALQILQRLAQARAFRDVFLQQDPALLDAFLRTAMASDCSTDIFKTCVVLLSNPLPEAIPLPSSAQGFFMQTFEKAIRTTDEQTVAVVYSLLDGACRDLLGVLPNDRLNYLEEQSYDLLKQASKSVKDSDNQQQRLCLGLMGLLVPLSQPRSKKIVISAGSPEEAQFSCPDRSVPVRSIDEIPRVFRGHAPRAFLHLAASRIISICGANSPGPVESAVRDLKITIDVLSVVPLEVRHGWPRESDTTLQIYGKLVEKVLKCSNQSEIQILGLAFIGLLHEGQSLPEPAVLAYEKALLACRQVLSHPRVLAEAVGVSLPCFSAQLKEDFVRETLCRCVQATAEPSSHLGEIQWLLLLTVLLSEMVQESKNIRRGLLLTMTADKFQDSLQNFLNFSPRSLPLAENSTPCGNVALDICRRLGLGICSLLLRAALMAQTDELEMDTQVGIRLLQKQQEFAAYQISGCHHVRPGQQHVSELSIVQAACTPYTQAGSHNWREHLARELEAQDKNRIGLIERRVGEVCRDLEARCNEVEEPLRLEQQRVRELQDELRKVRQRNGELGAQISELESREVDRELCMEGLESEKAQIEIDLQHASEAKENLSTRVQELQQMLSEANDTAQRTLDTARQGYDRANAEMRALLTKEETRCEEQANAMDQMRSQIAKAESDLRCATESIAQEQTINAEIRESLDGVLQELEEQKTAKLQAQAEVSDLLEKEAIVMNELNLVRGALVEAMRNNSELKADHHTALASLHDNVENMRSRFAEELDRIQEEASQQLGELDAQVQTKTEEIEQLVFRQREASEEIQARDTKIAELQQQVDKLTNAYTTARNRLEEAEAVRDRMYSALGFSDGGVFEQPTANRKRPSSRIAGTTPGRHSRRRTAKDFESQSNTDVEGEGRADSDRAESDETISVVAGSPTPKRSKHRRQQPFKPPMLKPMTSARPDARRRSTRLSQNKPASTTKRRPLEDVSAERGNSSPARKSTAGAEKAKLVENADRAGTIDEMDVSFDASEFFAGTPMTPSRHQEQDGGGDAGETTAEL